MTHLVWLGIIVSDPLIQLLSLSFLWIVTNIVVAFVGLLPESGGKGWKCRIISIAAYGMPIAVTAVVVAASVVANEENSNGMNAFVFIVAVAALSFGAWHKPRESRRCDTTAGPS